MHDFTPPEGWEEWRSRTDCGPSPYVEQAKVYVDWFLCGSPEGRAEIELAMRERGMAVSEEVTETDRAMFGICGIALAEREAR